MVLNESEDWSFISPETIGTLDLQDSSSQSFHIKSKIIFYVKLVHIYASLLEALKVLIAQCQDLQLWVGTEKLPRNHKKFLPHTDL